MSTAGAAQRKFDEPEAAVSALRLQTAERLAAHRARRGQPLAPALFDAEAASTKPETRAARIATTVAERYALSPSYRAFLAQEAERAHTEAQRARAVAEVARRTAEAVAAVQMQLLCELEQMAAEECAIAVSDLPLEVEEIASLQLLSAKPAGKAAALTVRLYEVPAPGDLRNTVANAVPYAALEEEDRMALDEEIAFRQAPVFEDLRQAAIPLPANLIEFPRHLVAARKARPRFAEGPLRDEEARGGNESPLRIFEVEPELIATAVEVEVAMPEWSSIRLEACAIAPAAFEQEYSIVSAHEPLTAAVSLRIMAALVDGLILAGALLGFVTAAAFFAGQLPSGQIAALSGGLAFAGLAAIYYLLCFTFSDATPGMRYARVSFCTLDDENPPRAAVRRRLIAMLLAACPLGLGLFWALVDSDGLGWHDRMSRMYPRSY